MPLQWRVKFDCPLGRDRKQAMDMLSPVNLFFLAFSALLVGAALSDVCRFTIPNWISLALVGLFIGAILVLPVEIGVLNQLGGMAVMLAGTLLLYSLGVLGGGDLKLASAVGLWVGFGGLLQLIIWIALVGGAFTLGLIVLRRLLTGVLVAQADVNQVTLPRILLPGEQIPYGVAIAAGGIWVGA